MKKKSNAGSAQVKAGSSQLSLVAFDDDEVRKSKPAKRVAERIDPPVRAASKPRATESKIEEPPRPRPASADAELTARLVEPPPAPVAKQSGKGKERRQSAEAMAAKQREISVSEFFTKNRHLLGFDNPGKALLTAVKEAVDNSLDACEEAGILPSLRVEIHELAEDRYQVVIEDNGPGIVKQQIPKIFGKLLYGSKFHRLKQSRGQQGIGISAACMYGQLTTGKAAVITSKTAPTRPASQFAIVLDTRKNTPEIVSEKELDWAVEHGTRVEIELQGSYKAGRRSVDEYLEQVAIANPHAELVYLPPRGRPPLQLPRASDELPPEPTEIKPHPYGVELGMLMKLLRDSKNRTVSGALQQDFSRVTTKVAEEICQAASVRASSSPRTLELAEIERLFKAIPKVKIMAPQTGCVVPIGEELIRRGLEREINADLYVSSTRPPAVYRGNPFRVEVGLAYGGSLRNEVDLETDTDVLEVKTEDRAQGPIQLLRFANRVPLQYQQSACAIFKAVVETNWKQYGLAQPRGGLPLGPMVLLVHFASAWVPFTSESKESIAHYPDIMREVKLALREVGRKLATFLHHRERARLDARRKSIFEMYIGELCVSLHNLTGSPTKPLQERLLELAAEHSGSDGLAAEAGVLPSVHHREGEAGGGEDWINGNGGSGAAEVDTANSAAEVEAANGKRRVKGKRKKGRPARSEELVS